MFSEVLVDNSVVPDPVEETGPVRTDIVIPYVFSTAIWQELKYALRSIEKNANFVHKVFLVADKLPKWANPETITLIPVEQIQGIPFAKAFDQYRKLEAVINHPGVSDDFVYAYDDQLWLKRVRTNKIKLNYCYKELRSLSDIIKSMPACGGNWRTMLNNSIDLLIQKGKPSHNFETHLPRVFNKANLKELFSEYNLSEQSPTLVSTLYYNHFVPENKKLLIRDRNTLKARIDQPYSLEHLRNLFMKYHFIDYNNSAITSDFKQTLSDFFPSGSLFELH